MGDFLRHPFGHQEANIAWLKQLFHQPITSGTNLPVHALGVEPLRDLVRTVYEELSQPLSLEGWAAIYDREAPDSLRRGLEPLLQGAFVVAFECSPILSNVCQKLGVPCLEVLVHPIRFYRDLLLSFRLTTADFYTVIRKFAIPYETLTDCAEGIKTRLAGRIASFAHRMSLITVQVPWDRSVIHKGRFASILDYAEVIAGLLEEGGGIVVKPHPDIGIPPDVTVWAEQHGFGTCSGNFYEVLACGGLDCVVSLSSSTLDEAEAFGVKTRRLLPRQSTFSYADRPVETGSFMTIFQNFLGARFWNAIVSTLPDANVRFVSDDWSPVNLRQSCGISWDWRPHILDHSQESQRKEMLNTAL